MSHPTAHGNGCSLEDCHTNLFALTDLDGIKWRRLNAEYPILDPLDDPVLQSFTKCIQADVLCVWRRVQRSTDQFTPDQLTCNKELCIFWYGEEPNTLNSLLSPDLKEVDRGAWDQNGLPYECRTLLFKALHNLIERCLLSQNFVRVGRWFVQPCEQGSNSTFTEKGAHLSIRFSFFLHGESQVCASIDVRQHTPLRRLQPFHLQYAQNGALHAGVNVVLAPYGLSGTLTGVTYKDTDITTQRLLDEWRQFYVLKDGDMREAPEANRVPLAVEVLVAGVRMRYPSTFVLVTADIENDVMARTNVGGNVGGSMHPQLPAPVHQGNLPLTPPTSPLNATFGGGADTPLKVPPPEEVPPVPPGGSAGLRVLTQRVVEKVWQDDAVSAGLQQPRHHGSGGGDAGSMDDNVGVWDINDPTQKSMCACSKKGGKCRMGHSSSGSKQGLPSLNKHAKTGDKLEKTPSSSSSRHSRPSTPFHRRGGYTEPFLQGEVDLPAPRVAAANAAAAAASAAAGTPYGSSFKGPTPNGNANSTIPTLGRNLEQSMDSPASAVPSPLVATPREPSVTQNGDPTMPTLSPQRLPAPNSDNPPLTNGETNGPGPVPGGGGPGGGSSNGPLSNATAEQTATPGSNSATPTANTTTTPSQPSVDGYGKPSSATPPSASNPTTPSSTPNPNAPPNAPNANTTPTNGRGEAHQNSLNHSGYSHNHLGAGTPSPYQPTPTPPMPAETKAETVNHWLEQQKQQQDLAGGIKRPLLPTKTYDDHDEELVTESLYDFESLQAWLEQPIKRHKSDLQQDSAKALRDSASGLTNSNSNSQLSRLRETPPTPPSTTDDPYLFSDENSTNTGSFSKRLSIGRSREDSFPRPSFGNRQDEPSSQRNSDSSFGKDDSDMSPPPVDAAPAGSSGPLLTERDLKPTVNDLDKLFESSDSENSEPDPFPVPTPPNVGKIEEMKSLGTKDGRLGTTDINGPTPTDLAVMYPTPPSLDNVQNQLSPGTTVDALQDQTILDHQTVLRPDIIQPISIEDMAIKDWSYVFKPPQQSVILGSQLYKPIELPSARLPPIPAVQQLAYKPWVYPLPMIEKHHHHHHHHSQSHYPNLPSVETSSMGPKSQQDRMSGMMEAPSPATFMTNQRTPMSYELQSPASNASSYLNKNMSSVDNTHTNSQVPEVNSLAVNIFLSDSILNLFKDHNFDSCTICVCNMNIKGADIGVYLTDKSNEPQYRCTCGFSAVTNRKYGARSGLFYEDEVDITGIRDERLEQRKPRLLAPEHLQGGKEAEANLPADVTEETMTLLRSQFSALFPSATVLHNYYRQRIDLVPSAPEVNLLEMQDGCEACYTALEAGRQVMDNCSSSKLEDPMQKATCLHKWPYIQENAAVPTNSQVVIRLLKSLQPLLQDTIQKKRGTMFWESVHTVSGPLTWKDFHLLAGRGADEASEPQPIPPIIVGYEKEWLSLSPYAFGFWDKLMLEPYGRQRDVAYVVVAPDNDFILTQLLGFFKELSTVYELLKLGRHCPISKTLRDGIMRVGKTAAQKVADEPVDEWFSVIGNSPVSAKLKLYAQVCQYRLAPYLARETLDKSLFESNQTSTSRPAQKAAPEPSPQPATPSNDSQPATPSSEERGESETAAPQKEVPEVEVEQDGSDGPSIVIYMVDPFTYGADWDHLRRLSMLGLLRCYQGMLSTLPESVLNNIQLQLIPLQAVLDFRETSTIPYLKQLSMSVYTHCRRHVAFTPLGRSLTGFGPTAGAEKILKAKDVVPGRLLSAPVFSPPFILAPLRESPLQLSESLERAGVMFCAYCLSEDQRWLLVSVTDDRGELLETCSINIEIPNRNRRKKASARRIGLAKLWDFVLGVMSMSATSWRLVVGRFGRMGHGELKGWAGLLSKKNLAYASKQLRDMCSQCSLLSTSEVPCILSACLISMEVHQSIHIMTDSVKAEEKKSSNIPLSTPRDASCTHILVFPTSATAQPNVNLNPAENPMDIGPDLPDMDEELFSAIHEDDMGMGMGDLNNIFFDMGSPGGSPKNNSAPGSPTPGGGDRNSPNQIHHGAGSAGQQGDPQDETPNLLQQPLAMGFYVSTSPAGPIPKWFWAACPHRQNICPACFKAALHIHCPMDKQNQDEFTHNTQSRTAHPLDSSFTCDVLRYVLETYNALSWLTMDPETNERRSCLPAHFMVLLQLYHAIEAFV